MIVSVYVDDPIITYNNLDLILGLKRQLDATFELIDLGILHYFLGLKFFPLFDGIFIYQPKYSLDILKHFKMGYCKLCATPF